VELIDDLTAFGGAGEALRFPAVGRRIHHLRGAVGPLRLKAGRGIWK
jgi:hypothetical protein